MRAKEMNGLRRTLRVALLAASIAVVGVVASAASAALGDTARGGGVELELPAGWEKVAPLRATPVGDPQTLLVIGTEGVRAAAGDCLVSSYRVPANGAVVVVIGWRDSVGTSGFLPLSGMKLRRGTFECFAGRGAVAQVTRRGRDFQLNVMVGDRATAETAQAALDAARSFGLAPKAG
jgi:hypothetical protein